jgi:hypothetical protein
LSARCTIGRSLSLKGVFRVKAFARIGGRAIPMGSSEAQVPGVSGSLCLQKGSRYARGEEI